MAEVTSLWYCSNIWSSLLPSPGPGALFYFQAAVDVYPVKQLSNFVQVQAEEKITPDSSKSTVDKVKEKVTNAADKVKREVVPDSHKSGTQAAKDKVSRS